VCLAGTVSVHPAALSVTANIHTYTYTYIHTYIHTYTHIYTCNEIIIKKIHACLYACETWSVTLREERRLRVFENRVLRRLFGHKRDEVTGEWRKLHKEEHNVLYSSPNIVRVIISRRV
jgi:hypothetical protein